MNFEKERCVGSNLKLVKYIIKFKVKISINNFIN